MIILKLLGVSTNLACNDLILYEIAKGSEDMLRSNKKEDTPRLLIKLKKKKERLFTKLSYWYEIKERSKLERIKFI